MLPEISVEPMRFATKKELQGFLGKTPRLDDDVLSSRGFARNCLQGHRKILPEISMEPMRFATKKELLGKDVGGLQEIAYKVTSHWHSMY